MDSREMMRRLALNPHNVSGPLHMCAHDVTAARFEAEGRAAAINASNPYSAGTMAAEHWEAGRAFTAAQNHFINVAQYDWTTGKAVYGRFIRRDLQTGQDHILTGWRKYADEKAFRRAAVGLECFSFERGAA